MSWNNLLRDGFYLTDGGLETTLIFHEGFELKHFAAFELLNHKRGRDVLKNYFGRYLNLASRFKTNFILEAPTWRASKDWGAKLGYSLKDMNMINDMAISFLRGIQAQYSLHTIISGNVGPRGDGYVAASCMQASEAKEYHLDQVATFAKAGADVVSAFTINYSDEAVGIVKASKIVDMPVVISFTLETDGRLPNGETLRDAIEKTDAETGNYVYYYTINCAHPEHFKETLKSDSKWKQRIWGVRANASTKSHKELDESETLDTGNKCKLAEGYNELLRLLPNLRVIGGCCGTDHTHIEEVGRFLLQKEGVADVSVA
jgi:S-methylmethionine-dependent homocysteine/selenocysteine methylase